MLASGSIVRFGKRRLAVLLGLVAVLTFVASTQITEEAIRSDGVQNLRFAENLARSGVFSSAAPSDQMRPGNEREPLPPLVLSSHLRLLNLASSDKEEGTLLRGARARLVKMGNLVWVSGGLIGAAVLTATLTDRFSLVVIALFLQTFFFFALPLFVDSLYTELQAGVLLIWSSWALVMGVSFRRVAFFLVAGILMALLTLTKGVFLYVAPLTIIAVAALSAHTDGCWAALRRFLAMSLGFLLFVFPWMARNKLLLNHFELTQRGGHVLLTRAVKDFMSPQEVVGAFYLWGPSFYQKLSTPLGFGAVPGDFQLGGRYQRLNREDSNFKSSDLIAQAKGKPEEAVSFYRRASAELQRYVMNARSSGSPYPQRDGDQQAKERAKSLILSSPGRHLLMTGPFFWRGIWSQPNQGVLVKSNPLYVVFKDLLALLSILGLYTVFAIGAFRKQAIYLALTLLPVLMISFYAVMTHNIPRYAASAIPLMLTCLLVLAARSASERRPMPTAGNPQ